MGAGARKGDSEEKVIEALFAADVAVEDVESKDGVITVFTPPAEFYKAKTAVLQAMPGVELDVQEITFLPQATKTLGAEELATFEKFLQTLEENEDVREVYHNNVLPYAATSSSIAEASIFWAPSRSLAVSRASEHTDG